MKFKSLEEFKKVRKNAAQWRAFETQLNQLDDDEQEVLRGVLMVEPIDNRTDPSFEKRLYEGYKIVIDRLDKGLPLIDEAKQEEESQIRYQQQQFEEAIRFVGLQQGDVQTSHSPQDQNLSDISSCDSMWSYTSSRANYYPSPDVLSTPSPYWSPKSPVGSELYFTPPTTPKAPSTPKVFTTPTISTSYSFLTPPRTPKSHSSESPETPEAPLSPEPPVTPDVMDLVLRRPPTPICSGNWYQDTSPAANPQATRKKVGRPRKGEIRPPKPKPIKRRKPQKKFSDETLRAIRPTPPRTRGSQKQ